MSAAPATTPGHAIVDTPMNPPPTKLGIVGCGFVAELYMNTLAAYPNLCVVGVHDRDGTRAQRFAAAHQLQTYDSLDQLLDLAQPDIILNLTNPAAHADISHHCLERDVHVYSEKPLALDLDTARDLVQAAEDNDLRIAAAPCTVLSENAQTMWRALRQDSIGQPRLAYVELDDGMVPRMPYQYWRNAHDTPWPANDEFVVGCTLEHAGYALSWLCAFFGPVQQMTAFASEIIPEKNGSTDQPCGPDFSVACLHFATGLVARLTCSIVAPHNHQFTIVGDDGVLATDETWRARAPVYYRRRHRLRRRVILTPFKRRLPLLGTQSTPEVRYRGSQRIDFARGVADLAEAIADQRPPRLSSYFSLHVTELSLAIHAAQHNGATYTPTTTFDPMPPMDWAR
jgi:predicted dehydrogenase